MNLFYLVSALLWVGAMNVQILPFPAKLQITLGVSSALVAIVMWVMGLRYEYRKNPNLMGSAQLWSTIVVLIGVILLVVRFAPK